MYETYQAVAERLGMRLTPPDPGLTTFFIDLDGTVDGRQVHVRRAIGSNGFFVVETWWTPSLGAGLVVYGAGLLDSVLALVGVHDLQLGDAQFDKLFHIQAKDTDRARQILRPDVRAALLALGGDVKLTDQSVSVRFHHDRESADLIEEVCRGVTGVAALVASAA